MSAAIAWRPRGSAACLRHATFWACLVVATTATQGAAASNAIDSPEGGTEQISRGGAWVARADTPMAAYYNPAGLVTQSSGASIGAQLMLRSHCFDRVDAEGNRIAPSPGFAAPPGEVCADTPPFPNPQLGVNIRLHKQWAIGLAVVGPHAHGGTEWPSTITYENNFGVEAEAPAPQRYLLLHADALLMFPTLSVAFAPIKELSIGAGFSWGIAALETANVNEAVSPARCADPSLACPSPGNVQPDDFTNDVRAQIAGFDGIVPGFVVGLLWQPSRRVNVGAWYRYSDAIRTSIDLHTDAPYYSPQGSLNPEPVTTDVEDAGMFELELPMEARIGVRYRPRKGAHNQEWISKHGGWAHDSMAEDHFDIELDVTWAHNSAIDVVSVEFNERHAINGTPGTIPLNASIVHEWKDSIGVRLGGEYVPIPDTLALRLGGFFESKAATDAYNNIDFQASERAGIGGGVGVRLSRFDINVAYQHTFFFDIDNGGAGEVHAISGDNSVGYRTRQPVNGGRTTSSLNEIGLGATVHW